MHSFWIASQSWPLTPFISTPVLCLSLSCSPVNASLSGWIKAACPNRRRRQRGSARCSWWVWRSPFLWGRTQSCVRWIHFLFFFISVSCQDLGSSDLRKDVYIVVHIIRIGTANDATVRTTWLCSCDSLCWCACVQGGWEPERRRTCAACSTDGRSAALSSASLISSLLTPRMTTCSRSMRKSQQTARRFSLPKIKAWSSHL